MSDWLKNNGHGDDEIAKIKRIQEGIPIEIKTNASESANAWHCFDKAMREKYPDVFREAHEFYRNNPNASEQFDAYAQNAMSPQDRKKGLELRGRHYQDYDLLQQEAEKSAIRQGLNQPLEAGGSRLWVPAAMEFVTESGASCPVVTSQNNSTPASKAPAKNISMRLGA